MKREIAMLSGTRTAQQLAGGTRFEPTSQYTPFPATLAFRPEVEFHLRQVTNLIGFIIRYLAVTGFDTGGVSARFARCRQTSVKLYAARCIGRTSSAILLPVSPSACFRSKALCRFSQNCAVVSK